MMSSREIIREQALLLFSRRGYDAVGIQEIVDAAGITKPSLYHHFGSKKGLFTALLTEAYAPLLAAVREASRYEGDLGTNLDRVAGVVFSFVERQPDFFRLRLALDFIPPDNEIRPIARALSEEFFAAIEELFREASRDHGNMRGRHAMHAASFIGQLHTAASLSLNGYIDLSDDVRRQTVRFFMHGIFS